MAFEVFEWNEWIRLLLGGDEAPFLYGLRRAVYGYRFLRGRSAEDLRRGYGSEGEREDIFQDVVIQTLHLLDATGKRSDEEISREISIIIRNVVKRHYRRGRRENRLFLSYDGGHSDTGEPAHLDTPDLKPTPEAQLIGKQFVALIQSELTPYQAFILRGYERFGLGPYSAQELATIRGVSVKAIEKQVKVVRGKIIEFALKNGYRKPGGNPVRDDRAAKAAADTPQTKARR